jgi:hypothetical protein
VTFGNGRFVAAGDNGRLDTSTDGISWNGSTPGGDRFQAIAYGDGRFVAVGINGRRGVTEDGANLIRDVQGGISLVGIVFVNGRFVASGGDVTWHSTDGGDSWQPHASPNLAAITYGNGVYIANGFANEVYTSADAITWTRRATPGDFGALGFGVPN